MKKKAARMACIAMACLILGSLSGEVYASTISEIKKQQEEDKKKRKEEKAKKGNRAALVKRLRRSMRNWCRSSPA